MDSVIVTGASTGIGEATAKALLKKGLQVFAGARKEKDLQKLKELGMKAISLDVTNEDSLQKAKEQIAKLRKTGGRLSLVNNAGVAVGGPVEGVSLKKWREQFEVNVFGLIRTTQVFLPWIRESQGRVVNISSVSGLTAIPYLGPYAASKFAVEAISDSLRREIQRFGCKVVVIEPGPIQTPIWEKSLGNMDSMMEDVPAHMRPIYEKEIKTFVKMVEKSAENAVPTEKVTRVIEKALLLANPRTRYVVGNLSVSLQASLASFLPDKLLDKMIASQL